jgi:hypothetical protein
MTICIDTSSFSQALIEARVLFEQAWPYLVWGAVGLYLIWGMQEGGR